MLYKWFSICSIHKDYESGCKLCNTGNKVFLPTLFIRQKFYKYFPNLWMKISNRKKIEFKDKKTGNDVKPFPNLK